MTVDMVVSYGNAAACWVLDWLGQGLLLGTLLAGLTWLSIGTLRKRVSAPIHVAMWSIVLVKFLAPVGPSWSPSLAGTYRIVRNAVPTSLIQTGIKEPDRTPQQAPPAAAKAEHPIPSGRTQRWSGWHVPIAGAYLAVVAALLAVRFRSYRAFRVRCRTLPSADGRTRCLVAGVCRRLGVRRIPATSISDDPPAPFVMGYFRPMLVLSRRQLVRPDELETVIVHEIAHLRRGDVFVRLLQRIAGTFLFFWPVVAWVNRQIDTALEYACDEWALRHGRLTAGAYARFLLSMARPVRAVRTACHPVCMATRTSTIERRIGMILESRDHSQRKRTLGGLPTLALLLIWGSFAFAGAPQGTSAENTTWPETEEAVKQRAVELYDLVARHKAADFDSDGILSYTEKIAYLVALAMQDAEAFMVEFPYADRNHSGRLDCLEAFGVVQAITRIAYLDRRIGAEIEAVRNTGPGDTRQRIDEVHRKYEPELMALLHEALDAQQWLLDNARLEPTVHDLDNLWSIIRRIQGPPGSFSNRMLNHGGPEPDPTGKARHSANAGRFQELEANIADVQAKLVQATTPDEIAKLRVMLTKLEAILAGLQED